MSLISLINAFSRGRRRRRRRTTGAVPAVVAAVVALSAAGLIQGGSAGTAGAAGAAAAGAVPPATVSRYERSADPWAAFQQGAADGKAGSTGATILDFGRPAQDAAGAPATLDFGGNLDPLAAVTSAVERYVDGYRLNARPGSALSVFIGTNNSCGTGQPCGGSTCGCPHEPPDYTSWGQAWAQEVNVLSGWISASAAPYRVTVRAGGADDAEPGFDPAYTNTYATLSGYARTSGLAMLDYGSLDGGPGSSFWTAAQMYQVAYGFKPDSPFPEVYGPGMADEWAALSHWAAANASGPMKIYGVLSEYPSGYRPARAYATLLGALDHDYSDTGQAAVQWSSNMGSTPLVSRSPVLSVVAGSDREATAVASSRAAYPAGRSARAAVLARSDTYPDALVGGPLAAAMAAPLLLTSTLTLDRPVRDELTRVLPPGSTVYLLGGPAALSPAVALQITAAGFVPRRLSGPDRYSTAVSVARALGNPSTLLVATGSDFPDALVAGASAADIRAAVLLSAGSQAAAATTAYLASAPRDTVYAIGGPAGVAYPSVPRLAAADRYQTAAVVAARLVPETSGVGLASGVAFPDGLVAAPLLARHGRPLLLSDPAVLPAGTASYLGRARTTLARIEVVGGSAALSAAVEYEARYVASS